MRSISKKKEKAVFFSLLILPLSLSRPSAYLINKKKPIVIEREKQKRPNDYSLIACKIFHKRDRTGEVENHFSNILVCLSFTYDKYVTNILFPFFSLLRHRRRCRRLLLFLYLSIYLSATLGIRGQRESAFA